MPAGKPGRAGGPESPFHQPEDRPAAGGPPRQPEIPAGRGRPVRRAVRPRCAYDGHRDLSRGGGTRGAHRAGTRARRVAGRGRSPRHDLGHQADGPRVLGRGGTRSAGSVLPAGGPLLLGGGGGTGRGPEGAGRGPGEHCAGGRGEGDGVAHRRGAIRMKKFSAILITKNEERNVAECIATLTFVDEVVVVDSGSTDRTEELCRRDPRIRWFAEEWKGDGPQKNSALEKAAAPGVFSMDAHERGRRRV